MSAEAPLGLNVSGPTCTSMHSVDPDTDPATATWIIEEARRNRRINCGDIEDVLAVLARIEALLQK